jgi:hypothetical protein
MRSLIQSHAGYHVQPDLSHHWKLDPFEAGCAEPFLSDPKAVRPRRMVT